LNLLASEQLHLEQSNQLPSSSLEGTKSVEPTTAIFAATRVALDCDLSAKIDKRFRISSEQIILADFCSSVPFLELQIHCANRFRLIATCCQLAPTALAAWL
jgi:hypothetical protein